eukprot:2981416-Rhodomonas_salina.3
MEDRVREEARVAKPRRGTHVRIRDRKSHANEEYLEDDDGEADAQLQRREFIHVTIFARKTSIRGPVHACA